ncbi:MAG: hypothetical protein U0V75_10150 [Ferruginibacter sp.]
MKCCFLILVPVLLACSCKKEKTPAENWFQVEIRSPLNADCRLPEIIFIDKQQEAYAIIGNNGGIYIANGLPKVLYAMGNRLYVNIQRPGAAGSVACTTLGPSLPQVLITAVK